VDGQPLKSKVSFCTGIVPSALTTKVMVSWMRISPESKCPLWDAVLA